MDRIELRDGGWLLFVPDLLRAEEASQLLNRLQAEIPWRQERIYGRPVPRLNAWFADPGTSYTYSGLRFHGCGWPEWLLPPKHRIEEVTGTGFNSLLLNRYRHGRDSIGFHADAEPELGADPIIATLSLGAARTFVLKHRATGEKLSLPLPEGSLLVMGGSSQHYWLHGIPKEPDLQGERISLTFRKIIGPVS